MIQGTQVSSTHWSIQRKCHSAIVNHGQDTGKTIQDTVKGQRQQQFYMSFMQEIYKVMKSMWKISSLLKVHVYLEVGDVSHTSKKEQNHYVFLLYSSEVFMRKELVLFLLNFQGIWPLTSIAEGLYSRVMFLAQNKLIPFGCDR